MKFYGSKKDNNFKIFVLTFTQTASRRSVDCHSHVFFHHTQESL